jgi:hypothetical protein
MKKLLLIAALTSACFAREERPFHELVQTIQDYTLEVADSLRLDHEIWCAFALPVFTALTNPDRQRPYDSPPILSAADHQALSLLAAYVAKRRTLDASAIDAVETLVELYSSPLRNERYKDRSLSAQAITDRVNQSRIQREHARRASPEERNIRRFDHEGKVKRKHLKLQERAIRRTQFNYNNAARKREERRLQLENQERLAERKQIWRAKKKAEYEAQLKAQMEHDEQERIRLEREERKRIREALLSK